jgi:hypothetical protein
MLLLCKLHAIAARSTASTQRRRDFFLVTAARTTTHNRRVNRASAKRESRRAFEVDSSPRRFLAGQHEGGRGHTGVNGNTRGGMRPSAHSVIKRSGRVKFFRIFDSFPAAIDRNVIRSAVVVRLNHVVQVAALNATGFLVLELLVDEPIQVTAASRVSDTEKQFKTRAKRRHRLSSLGSVFAAWRASIHPTSVSMYFSLLMPELLRTMSSTVSIELL